MAGAERLARWRSKVLCGQLGVGAELWKPVPDSAPSRQALHSILVSAAERLPEDYRELPGEFDVREASSRELLMDVVWAAGGVENAVKKLLTLYSGLKVHLVEHSDVAETWQQIPDEVYYSFSDVLHWTRCLHERLDRSHWKNRGFRLGLLPALADGGLKEKVSLLFDGLKAAHLAEARRWANFSLHSGALPRSGTARARVLNRRLVVFVPDSGGEIETWQGLRYTEQREMTTWAEALLCGVEAFMDALLCAFEAEVPERLRPQD